jgi:hypothetical protein
MQFLDDSAPNGQALHLGKIFNGRKASGERCFTHRSRGYLDLLSRDPNRQFQIERVFEIQQGTRNLQMVIVDLLRIQMYASLKNIHNIPVKWLSNDPDRPHD